MSSCHSNCLLLAALTLLSLSVFLCSSPSSRRLMHEHFCYWALLHSSLSGCFMMQGGKPQRHWSVSASRAFSPHFHFYSSLLLSSFYALLPFSHLAQPQTSAQVHVEHVLSVIHTWHAHTLEQPWGAGLRCMSVLNHLTPSQEVDHLTIEELKRKTTFLLPLLMHVCIVLT